MFYIEKNDKPNIIERQFKIIKKKENTIYLPITEKTTEKQIEKIAKRTTKIIQKHSKSKKVILSKEMKKEQLYTNWLNINQIQISDGAFLFELLIPQIIEYIINKKNFEAKSEISVLVNDITDIELENIKELSRKYKNINIITNHIEKFKKIENELNRREGIILAITNNKKRSLAKSQIIVNIDFPDELINKYNIKEDAIIINVKQKVKINKKRFNGTCINDYEVDYKKELKEDERNKNNKYCLKDIYESELYRKQRVKNLKEKIRKDKVTIKKVYTNNSEI